MTWMDEHRVGWVTSFTTSLMDVSESPWVVVAVLLVAVAIVAWRRAWPTGLALGTAAFYAGSVSDYFKHHVERTRPAFPDVIVQVDGYAMPSSHAAVTAAASFALLAVLRWDTRKALVLTASVLLVLLLITGVSMVYLGAHWPSDVLVGWALGAVVGTGVGLLFRPRMTAQDSVVAGMR